MTGRVTLLAFAFAFAALGPHGEAAASPAPAVRWIRPGLVTAGGPAWYAVTLERGPRSGYDVVATYTALPGFHTPSCLHVVDDPIWGGAHVLGSYAVPLERRDRIRVHAESVEGGPAPAVEYGEAPGGYEDGDRELCGWGSWTVSGSRTTILLVVAPAGPIAGVTIRLKLVGSVRVVAESFGPALPARREWDFSSPATATAWHGAQPVEGVHANVFADASALSRSAATVRRRAATYFATTPTAAGLVFVPSPTMLWARGPARGNTPASSDTQYEMQRLAFLGPPGRYDYGFDLLAAPAAVAYHDDAPIVTAAGQVPFVVLIAADVDYPACSTKPVRVVARGRNGHVVCRG